jgi:hypothetical protein
MYFARKRASLKALKVIRGANSIAITKDVAKTDQ